MESWLKPALDELTQQHLHSLKGMEALKAEHRQWRDDVASLINKLELRLDAPSVFKADSLLLAKLPQKPTGQPRPTKPMPADGDLCDIFLEDVDRVEGDSQDRQNVLEVPDLEFAPEDTATGGPAVQNGISFKKLRISTVQNFKTAPGPLRKVINEILEDAMEAAEEKRENQKKKAKRPWPCEVAERLLASKWFEIVTGIIIFVNMLTIGIEAQLSLSRTGVPEWVETMEKAFLFIYTLELLARVMAGGFRAFWNAWFLLDFFLVAVGVLAIMLRWLGPDSPLSIDGFEKILVFRALRLLRLVRALRMFEHFKVVWHLVYALLSAGRTVLSATALIAFTLYIFACVAVEIITKDVVILENDETYEIVQTYFSSLPRASLTLLQFVTLDSIAAVYSPLIMTRPYLGAYFASILIFVSIGLMNLITAVIIEGAMESSKEKREEERMEMKEKIRQSLPGLLDMFFSLDTERTGRIHRDQLQNNALQHLPQALLDNLPIDDVVDLFDILDVDENNYLTQAEFVEGLLNMALLDTPLWNVQALKLLSKIAHVTSQIHEESLRLSEERLRFGDGVHSSHL
ncbi:Scn11a [Symbiodinium sp. KB8]|nr:Scn11a [Symbiodinium sp. KB8]